MKNIFLKFVLIVGIFKIQLAHVRNHVVDY